MSGDHEKMEMEVLLTRSAGLNGGGDFMMGAVEDDEDDDGQPNVYRQKCERMSRELELAKQRLNQQHEDDLEQMVTLKKQLEKKLNDAYEEVEEQRQVVAQWKRKAQRLAAELNDTRLLHEDQTNRNAILEKKQRKFDTEFQMLQDELRQERTQKERAMRERDAAITDKLTSDQALQVLNFDPFRLVYFIVHRPRFFSFFDRPEHGPFGGGCFSLFVVVGWIPDPSTRECR